MEDLDRNKMEWVEIIEPRTKEHMYANLTTGECVWDPPPGVSVKRTTDNQWWELFDHKTSRFYYYNAATQRTVWHRPPNCDIIPLAKLQTLKQNTQVKSPSQDSASSKGGDESQSPSQNGPSTENVRPPAKKESVSTQTPSRSALSRNDRNGSTGGSGTRRSVEKHQDTSRPSSGGGGSVNAMTGTGTQTCSTSPVASPRPHRRHHHHHHNHHNHQCGSTSGSINKHGHCPHPQSDEDVDAAHLEPLAQLSAQQQQQRKVRRGTSHGGWYNRHGKSQDSGRSSDSSTLSLSKRSDKLGSSAGSGPLGGSSLTSPLRGTPTSGRRPTLDPPPMEFGIGSTASTPLSSRKKGSSSSGGGGGIGSGGGLELSRQRSLDSETSPVSGLMGSAGLLMGSNSTSTTPTPIRSHKPNDLFYRDGSLSRSLSFMQQRRPQTARGQGPLFDLWSPQREHQLISGANSESAPGVDSLCTPMINRKQRSFESGGSGGSTGNSKPSRVYHSQLDSPKLQHLSSSSSSQQQQPRQQRPLGSSASFRTSSSTGSGGRDQPRQFGGGSFGSDSSPSPKRESKEQRDSLGRVLRSTDSSPHSAGDSGLATTGSRASQDSRTKSNNVASKSSPSSSSPSAQLGASAIGNSSQPSTASAAADANGCPVEAAGGPVYDPVPLYSNIDYNYYLDSKAQAHLLPLQQYILEQAKLSGYRFGDSSPIAEDGGAGGRTGVDHFRSDDEEEHDSLRHRLRVPTHLHPAEHDDSDDFADDEGMSNVEDSSSLEYLDESQYLEEDDHYTQFLLPPAPPHRQQSKTLLHHFGPGSGPNPSGYTVSADVIVEPEYTEADPGISGGTYRSLPDGPMASGPVVSPNSSALMHSGSTSSLRPRPKESMMIHPSSSLYSPVMDRAGPFAMEGFRQSVDSAIQAPSSKTSPLQRSSSTLGPNGKGPTTPTDGDIEKYAQSHLNIHKKGLFRKNLSIRDMLSWSKDPIRKPMLPLEDKTLKKEACDLFKLVQIYMGDRKCKPGMTCNSVALELCNHAWNKPALRDELYLHICRQTTENPRKESLRRGWELMAVCLYFFPPSPKLEPYLDGYINRHRDPGLNFTEVAKWPIHVQVSHYATISCRRLMRIGASGRRHERKPTLEEIEQARLQIFRPSMFGNTLEEIMMVQRDRFPHRKLPWIQTTLSEEILRLQGAQTEGIFRVPADVDEVNSLKNRMDQWEVCPVSDAHVPASLLKLWYRELYESLIPDELYQDCVQYCADPERAVAIVHRLPEFHRLVLSYLIRFLQIFSQTEVSSVTKMDASNLAMVMAPNCLRCNASDPKVIFDNARKEMAFIRTLIQHLDTSFMEGVV